jgi:hypothetical protein
MTSQLFCLLEQMKEVQEITALQAWGNALTLDVFYPRASKGMSGT